MKKLYAITLLLTVHSAAHAQSYCSPTFGYGCTLWRNLTIDIGTIGWAIGNTSCLDFDYTNLSTTLTAGVPEQMTVSSGNWTGCAVWIDLNNDLVFQDSENLYYSYVGGDPSYTYDFTITVPPGTPSGSYRMRVIAPWGSDGFLDSNLNGYGPCGSYQYGNFDDFTVDVIAPTGMPATVSTLNAVPYPNPADHRLHIDLGGAAGPAQLIIRDGLGRELIAQRVQAGGLLAMDVSGLPAGLYTLQLVQDGAARNMPFIKK